MSRATPDDQLKFLLTCVKHSNNGKIDFIEVAKECSIVSKGAAAKRYERLMKANGIHPNGGQSTEPPVKPPSSTKSSAKAKVAAAAKKRKMDGGAPARFKDDEDDKPTRPKFEPEANRPIKHEPATISLDIGPPLANCGMSSSLGAGLEPPQRQYSLSNTSSMFDEFCTPEMFTQHTFEEDTQDTLHMGQHSSVPRSVSNMEPQSRELVLRSGVAPQETIIIAD